MTEAEQAGIAASCVTTLGTYTISAISPEVALARRWLSRLLAKDHAAVLDDVVLLASEVITNSILHSDSARLGESGHPGIVTLTALDVGDAVRVEVTDAGSGRTIPRIVDDGLEAINGLVRAWRTPGGAFGASGADGAVPLG